MMDDDVFTTDYHKALMDQNIRSKITYDLNTWSKHIESQLIKFGRDPDLSSPDADNRTLRFLGESVGEDERTINEQDTIAASYHTLEKISFIRKSINAGQYPEALSHALDAWVSFMIANYAMGKKFWDDARKAAEARTDEMIANSKTGKKYLDHARNGLEIRAQEDFEFYKRLIFLDDKYKQDPIDGKRKYSRAKRIKEDLGLDLTVRAIVNGIERTRKKLAEMEVSLPLPRPIS